MAEVATARAKRARSPSPSYVDTLASPLEVLLKRRRRTTWTTNAGAGPPVWDEDREFPGPSSHHEMSSPLARGGQERDVGFDDSGPPEVGVERRRARQWERLQAPQLSLSQSQAQAQTMSQPPPPMPDSSPLRYSRAARAISHPPAAELPTTQHLSSSPVRHQPPSSTPFRADDGWSVQERLQEWGEEYASQNSLLHSLVSSKATHL